MARLHGLVLRAQEGHHRHDGARAFVPFCAEFAKLYQRDGRPASYLNDRNPQAGGEGGGGGGADAADQYGGRGEAARHAEFGWGMRLVKQAGLIKDRRIRNIWQGRGKLALAQAYMHENKYRTAERRYIRAAKHFFVCNSQRECMAHVCLWELYMDQPKRGTRDYSKAVVAAKRMLELMGPDQKEDRDRIEDMMARLQDDTRRTDLANSMMPQCVVAVDDDQL